MALNFTNTTDKVNHGTATVLDNLDPFTVIAWAMSTTIGANGDKIYMKGLGNNTEELAFDSTTVMAVRRGRATAAALATATLTNFAAWGANKWLFLAGTCNTSVSGDNKLFIGDLTTPAAEPSSYGGSQTVGSGTVGNNNGAAAIVGNRSSDNRNWNGRIALVGVWNRLLTQGELWDQQWRPHPTSGNVFFIPFGFNSGGTQFDWSVLGANNGTITGATVADHVPLPPLYGMERYTLGGGAAAAPSPKRLTTLGIGDVIPIGFGLEEWLRHRKNLMRRLRRQHQQHPLRSR